MRRVQLFIFFIIFSTAIPRSVFAQANEDKKMIRAEVADDVTLQPVKNVKVTILRAKDSTEIATAEIWNGKQGNRVYASVRFYISKVGDYIAKCEAPGYETTYNNFSITKLYKHEDIISLDKLFYIKNFVKSVNTHLVR